MSGGLQSEEELTTDEIKNIIFEKEIIGTGEWKDNKSDQCKQFKDGIENGDVILVRNGIVPIALVMVIEKNIKATVYENEHRIKIIGIYNSEIQTNIGQYNGQTKGTLTRVANRENPTGKFIINWHTYMLKSQQMNSTLELLIYKKQIILQGPPGTGKTRLAKEIAKEMTKPKNTGSPSNLINNFFQNFDVNIPKVKEKRENLNSLLTEFQQKFPKEELKNITIERYAFGGGENDSFCYWLEYILHELGLYSGFARKFLIYWKKETSSYIKSGFIKNNSDEEAMSLIAEQISNIANNIKLEEALSKLGNGFILKIIYSYNPDLYFPINSAKSIDNALRLLGFENNNLNLIEKSKKLQELFLEKKKEFSADVTNIEFMDFLFTNFNMKGNLSIQKDEVLNEGSFKIIQFHPAYSYEDFVRGIVVKMNENNQPTYEVENKILTEFAQSAIDNQSANYVLIIDEINRANLPAVLGELIYALEYRFDSHNENETTVDSIYSIKENEEDIIGNRKLKLPKNLYIIGTMNTADRSVGHIDYAIRRRFAFVDVLPEIEPVHPLVENLFKSVSELFIDKLDEYDPNNEIKPAKETLASDFRPEDVWIGHSYFICKKENGTINLEDEMAKPILINKMKYEVLPILKEYLKDGILLENNKVTDVLNKISKWCKE